MQKLRQFGGFSLEPLICLLLTSIIIAWIFHWQKIVFDRVNTQRQQIIHIQSGMSLISILISLLLTCISLLAIFQIHLTVHRTKMAIEDYLRQQQVAVLFYLALEPYIEKALYLGCNSKLSSIGPFLKIYHPTDPQVPEAIGQKALADIFVLQIIKESVEIMDHNPSIKIKKPHPFNIGDSVVLNNCEQVAINKIKEIKEDRITLNSGDRVNTDTVHLLETCWFYLAKSNFNYPNHKPMHTLFAKCDHQPPNSLIRGIESWQINLKKNFIIFTWKSESSLRQAGLDWQSTFNLYNAL